MFKNNSLQLELTRRALGLRRPTHLAPKASFQEIYPMQPPHWSSLPPTEEEQIGFLSWPSSPLP
ncbi:hypothetical protein ACS0TY_000196 [Phlomoides rotata]